MTAFFDSAAYTWVILPVLIFFTRIIDVSLGTLRIIFIIIERKDIPSIVKTIQKYNPNAFYSVEDVRFVSGAVTPYRLPAPRRWTHFHSRMRKKV